MQISPDNPFQPGFTGAARHGQALEGQLERCAAPGEVEGALAQVIVLVIRILYAQHLRPRCLHEAVVGLVIEPATVPAGPHSVWQEFFNLLLHSLRLAVLNCGTWLTHKWSFQEGKARKHIAAAFTHSSWECLKPQPVKFLQRGCTGTAYRQEGC